METSTAGCICCQSLWLGRSPPQNEREQSPPDCSTPARQMYQSISHWVGTLEGTMGIYNTSYCVHGSIFSSAALQLSVTM